MHYAVHGHTAAELIYERADADNFNPAKSENARLPQCKPEKEDAIMQAFRHFGII